MPRWNKTRKKRGRNGKQYKLASGPSIRRCGSAKSSRPASPHGLLAYCDREEGRHGGQSSAPAQAPQATAHSQRRATATGRGPLRAFSPRAGPCSKGIASAGCHAAVENSKEETASPITVERGSFRLKRNVQVLATALDPLAYRRGNHIAHAVHQNGSGSERTGFA